MLKKTMKKLIATLVLSVFVGYAGTPIIAEASPQHTSKDPGQRIEQQKDEQRIQRQKEEQRKERQREEEREHQRREEQKKHHHKDKKPDHESHSDTGNLVTGLIIGGVVGAVIANNS